MLAAAGDGSTRAWEAADTARGGGHSGNARQWANRCLSGPVTSGGTTPNANQTKQHKTCSCGSLARACLVSLALGMVLRPSYGGMRHACKLEKGTESVYWKDALEAVPGHQTHCGLLPMVMLEDERAVVLLVLLQRGTMCCYYHVAGWLA